MDINIIYSDMQDYDNGRGDGFRKACKEILAFINSHQRQDEDTFYYRLSVEDIIKYVENLES